MGLGATQRLTHTHTRADTNPRVMFAAQLQLQGVQVGGRRQLHGADEGRPGLRAHAADARLPHRSQLARLRGRAAGVGDGSLVRRASFEQRLSDPS